MTRDRLADGGSVSPGVSGALAGSGPPGELRALFTDTEWSGFESEVRRWLGEFSSAADCVLGVSAFGGGGVIFGGGQGFPAKS